MGLFIPTCWVDCVDTCHTCPVVHLRQIIRKCHLVLLYWPLSSKFGPDFSIEPGEQISSKIRIIITTQWSCPPKTNHFIMYLCTCNGFSRNDISPFIYDFWSFRYDRFSPILCPHYSSQLNEETQCSCALATICFGIILDLAVVTFHPKALSGLHPPTCLEDLTVTSHKLSLRNWDVHLKGIILEWHLTLYVNMSVCSSVYFHCNDFILNFSLDFFTDNL